jgi:CRP-like cAMP-binding protein
MHYQPLERPLLHRVNGLNTPVVSNTRVNMAQRSSLFADISAPDCTTIVSSAHERQFSRRQTIFLEGDPVRQVLLLISGCVKVTQFGQSGCEVILRLSGPGEVVGVLGNFSQPSHCSTAQALDSTAALVWDPSQFESLSERFPILRRNAVHILQERLREMDQRFREISTEKVAPRLSSQLVRLLKQVGKATNGHVEITLSREELAQLTGTTLFTVSRLLCQWEVLGILSARRESVLVRNLPALVKLAEGQ